MRRMAERVAAGAERPGADRPRGRPSSRDLLVARRLPVRGRGDRPGAPGARTLRPHREPVPAGRARRRARAPAARGSAAGRRRRAPGRLARARPRSRGRGHARSARSSPSRSPTSSAPRSRRATHPADANDRRLLSRYTDHRLGLAGRGRRIDPSRISPGSFPASRDGVSAAMRPERSPRRRHVESPDRSAVRPVVRSGCHGRAATAWHRLAARRVGRPRASPRTVIVAVLPRRTPANMHDPH